MKTLAQFAKAALDAVNEDREVAIAQVTTRLLENPEEYQAIIEPIIRKAVKETVDEQGRQRRSYLVRYGYIPTNTKGASGEHLEETTHHEAEFAAIQDGLLHQWWLNTVKKPLGKATRSDLQEEIEVYTTQIHGTLRNRAFLDRIAEALSGEETVADHFTEDEVKELLTEVKAGQEAPALN